MKRSSSSSSSSSRNNSPPHSPRGLKRTNECESSLGSSAGKTKQAKLERTGHESVRGPIDVDALWLQLPPELVQKIASELRPTRINFTDQEDTNPFKTTLTMAQSLFHLAMTNRRTFNCVWGLLYWARWAVELAQLHRQTPTKIAVDFLLSNPMETVHGNVLKFAPPEFKERRLDALLQGLLKCIPSPVKGNSCLNSLLEASLNFDSAEHRAFRDRSEQAEALLTRLFDAWCERLKNAVNTSAHLTHLPLDDLPLRLFRCAPCGEDRTLDPNFLRRVVGRPMSLELDPASGPVKLLLQHLGRMNKELKLFVWLHLDLMLDNTDNDDVMQALQEHGIADDEVIETVERWRDGFFLNMDEDEKPDEDLVMEVWEGLQRMPLLGAAVPLFMIIKFASMSSRDKSITDEQLVQLLHRAMVEMVEMVPGVACDRLDYVVLRAPEAFGVAAFKRLTPGQRELLFHTGSFDDPDFEDAYQPYQDALNAPTDTSADPTAPLS